MNRNRKIAAVAPIIGTIILIAGTIVIAAASGSYVISFNQSHTKISTIQSLNLYAGTASSKGGGSKCAGTAILLITFSNPGVGTGISTVTLTTAGLSTSVQGLVSGGKSCHPASGTVNAHSYTTFTIYFNLPINQSSIYGYYILLSNGQLFSSDAIAQ